MWLAPRRGTQVSWKIKRLHHGETITRLYELQQLIQILSHPLDVEPFIYPILKRMQRNLRRRLRRISQAPSRRLAAPMTEITRINRASKSAAPFFVAHSRPTDWAGDRAR